MQPKVEAVMENLRGLFIGLSALSMSIPILGSEGIVLAFGIASGVYYGFRIEREISSTSMGLRRSDFSYFPDIPGGMG